MKLFRNPNSPHELILAIIFFDISELKLLYFLLDEGRSEYLLCTWAGFGFLLQHELDNVG